MDLIYGWGFIVTNVAWAFVAVGTLMAGYRCGREHGRVQGYRFAKNPSAKEFSEVGHSLEDVIYAGDDETWQRWRPKTDDLF